jgi:hypothetical protein
MKIYYNEYCKISNHVIKEVKYTHYNNKTLLCDYKVKTIWKIVKNVNIPQ